MSLHNCNCFELPAASSWCYICGGVFGTNDDYNHIPTLCLACVKVEADTSNAFDPMLRGHWVP